MRLAKDLPSVERLRELLTYDPLTGEILWRVDRGVRYKAGSRAGGRSKYHRYVEIDGIRMLEHRVIWAIVTGAWPSLNVDHRDLDGFNNRWGNLREGTQSQNLANARARRNNTSGFKGVCKNRGRWVARLGKRGEKGCYLGSFATPEEAHAAYASAAEKRFGEFARFA